MTRTKLKEQTGLKFKNLMQKMSAGSGVGPGSKTGEAAENVQRRQRQYIKYMRNRKQCVQN
jgi:hypothetical protein